MGTIVLLVSVRTGISVWHAFQSLSMTRFVKSDLLVHISIRTFLSNSACTQFLNGYLVIYLAPVMHTCHVKLHAFGRKTTYVNTRIANYVDRVCNRFNAAAATALASMIYVGMTTWI